MAKLISVHILKDTYERLQREIKSSNQSVSGFITQSVIDYLSKVTSEKTILLSDTSVVSKEYNRVQFRPNQFLDQSLRKFADDRQLQISEIVREAIARSLPRE